MLSCLTKCGAAFIEGPACLGLSANDGRYPAGQVSFNRLRPEQQDRGTLDQAQQQEKGTVCVFYHFYKPDDVVSAVHFSDLCEGLARRGWDVTMMTSNRLCRYKGKVSPTEETLDGVDVKRSWRPGLSQSRNMLRIVNSLWIQVAWMLQFRRMAKPDAIIVGTDPQFSQLMLPLLRWLAPQSKIYFWSFDMYPEAVLAESSNGLVVSIAKLIYRMMPRLYRPVDVMVDIGPCMRSLLRKHNTTADYVTLVPWALSEPDFGIPVNEEVRVKMFGEDAALGVLYSGNMGMAHEYAEFLALARLLRERAPQIVFAFSSRGNRMDEFLAELTPEDTNIRILPFASLEELEDRLNAADIHLLSLKPKWDGIVVPSKFFGSLAAGKPVLYAGSATSCIGQWIRQYELGLLLDAERIEQTADKLIEYSDNPDALGDWKSAAYRTYQEQFSRNRVIDGWDASLLSKTTVS
jgi:glycosyltransferase involved in cell wall biosynthesis